MNSRTYLTIRISQPRFGLRRLAFGVRALLWSLASVLCTNAAFAAAEPLSIQNNSLEAQFDTPSGRFSLSALPTHHAFIKDGLLSSTNGTALVTNISDPAFGPGQAIEISYPDGNHDTISVYSNLPFALFRTALFNHEPKPKVMGPTIHTFSASVALAGNPDGLQTLGTGGLLPPAQNPGSYVWLALAEPKSRNGVVLGWLTENRGNGVVFTKVDGKKVGVEAQIDYGRLPLTNCGAIEELETLAVGYFDDARLGLEAWADNVAKVYDIHLPPQPAGYCTWYSQPYGGSSDEQHLAQQALFGAKHLVPFGFSVVQIDDHWQGGISTNGPKRNFTAARPDGPYPSGMKTAASNIKSLGLVPGLWFIPFAGTYYDPFFAQHQDWFVKHTDGRPYETTWGGTCLDMTYPPARDYVRSVVERIAQDWGYQYIKIDGLWTGLAAKLEYVNTGYKQDGLGDAVFHDPNKSNIEAYRDGLRLVREAAGPRVFVLGCNGPQNMRSYGGAFGLVDAMRIGPDNKSDWKNLLRGPTFGSRHYFLHGRVWYNDPDPVYVRQSVPLNHAQLICSWVGLSGALNLSSEWLPGLPPERLDLLKRTMPSHGLLPRPADLFEREIPGLWLLTDTRHTPRRDVLGIFNWESKEQTFDYSLSRLGLDENTEYAAFDYWSNTLLPSIHRRLHISVPAESCRIIAVRPRADHPQLLSTSRHITQGIIDVPEEKWNPSAHTLSGLSRVVAGDPYELRIASDAPAGTITLSPADQSAHVTSAISQKDNLVRVSLSSPATRTVSWSVKFN